MDFLKGKKYKSFIIVILLIMVVIIIGMLMPVQFGRIDLAVEFEDEVNAYGWLYYDIGSGFDDESERADVEVNPKVLSPKKVKNQQIYSINLSLFNSFKRIKFYVGNLETINAEIKKIELKYNGIPTVIFKGNQLEKYIEYSDKVEITSTDKSLVLNNCEYDNYLVLNKQFVKELKSKMLVNVKIFRMITILMIVLLILVITIVVKNLYKKNEKARKFIDSIKEIYLKCSVLELKKRHYVIYILGILVFLLNVFLIVLRKYVTARFNSIGFEEIMFYIYNADGTGQGMIKGFFRYGLVVFIIALVVLVLMGILIHSNKYLKNNRIVFIGILTIGLIIFGCEVHNYYDELDVGVYIYNQTHFSTLFEDEYIKPDEVKITFPEKKRNLIYIYLESMESTFADSESGGISEDNYIPELTELANNNINFSETTKMGGAYCAKDTDWTIAGIVAQSCSVPLKQNFEDLTGEGETFLSDNVCGGAKAIGDILKENGYNQEFVLGSDVSFGKRDSFFKQHGDYKIFDYNTAIKEGKIDDDYYVWWGYEDEKLFEYAKEELGEISKEEPFNMTILTVDTHSPNGYKCDKCEDKYDDQYKNVLACSSKQVADFVKWIQKQDFYDNTTIVLVGDHITKASFSDFSDVDVSQNRVYECFINSAIEPEKEKERKFNTMDMYPTTLAALGVDIEGNRLGLGTNLFSSEETISEKIGYERIDEELSMKSKYYDKYIVK